MKASFYRSAAVTLCLLLGLGLNYLCITDQMSVAAAFATMACLGLVIPFARLLADIEADAARRPARHPHGAALARLPRH